MVANRQLQTQGRVLVGCGFTSISNRSPAWRSTSGSSLELKRDALEQHNLLLVNRQGPQTFVHNWLALVILDFYTGLTPPVDTSKASVRPV